MSGGNVLLYDQDLEARLIGLLMLLSETDAQEEVKRALSIVRSRDFFGTTNRTVFAAIAALHKEGAHFGLEAVVTHLTHKRKLNGSLSKFDLEQMQAQASYAAPFKPEEEAVKVRVLGERREAHAAWKLMGQAMEGIESPARLRARWQEMLTGLHRTGYQTGLQGESAADLLSREFPEREEIVPPLLAAGECVLVVAPPKAGKSVLVLQMALAIASAGTALGTIDVFHSRPVLYLCLDDGAHRMQYRVRRMLDGMDVPPPRGLTFHYSWPRFDQGGLGMIEGWAERHPNGVVVIDILENVRPERGSHIYKGDYEALRPLSDLCHRTNLAAAVVHHTNRRGNKGLDTLPFETISGSEGLAGSVDGAIIFGRRQAGDPGVRIDVGGRDLPPGNYSLTWDEFLSGWRFDGESLQSKIKATLSPEREAIRDLIQKAGRPLTPAQIAERLGRTANVVRQLLFKMKAAEQIVAYDDGTYQHPAEHARTPPPPGFDADP